MICHCRDDTRSKSGANPSGSRSSTASLANWADRRASLCPGSQVQQLSAALPFAALLYFSHCLKIGSELFFFSPRPPAPPMVSLERRTGGRAPTLARPTGRAPEGARPAGPQIKSLLWTQLRAPPKRLSNGHQGRWYFHLWVLSWHAGAVARHHVRWVHWPSQRT